MKDVFAWVGLGILFAAFMGGFYRFVEWLEALYRRIFGSPEEEECDHITLVQDRPGRAHCPQCDRVWSLMQPGVNLNQTPSTFS